jgi:hypothetical protein
MKNFPFVLFTILALSFATANSTKAQAWDRDSKVLALGFGASQFFHIDNYYYRDAPGFRTWYWPLTGQINFQGEFAVHKYVGLGFTTGIGGRGPWIRHYVGEINAPIGMIVNFHFYQLIADHASRDIKADKLDIYAGINFGSGIAVAYYDNDVARIMPLAFGGPHVGVRYYFAPKVGVNGEFGFGKHLINVGFVFKI